MTTPEKLAELRRMLDAATPRPWISCEDEDEVLIVLDDDSNHWPGRYTAIARGFEQGDDYGLSDAMLVTAAVNALPALLDAAAERDALRDTLEETEGRLSRLLWDLTGGQLSKPTYPVDTMVSAIEEHLGEYYESDAQAERDALAAKVERVRALHIATPFWQLTPEGYAPDMESTAPDGAMCLACSEEHVTDDFENWELDLSDSGVVHYPCSTIRALDEEADA